MAKSVECSACGNVYSISEDKCPYCGAANVEKAGPAPAANTYAQQAPQQQQQPQVIVVQQPQYQGNHSNPPKDKTTALLLCFFLGWLGAHKFYEGKTGTGIVYFFTFGLLGIGVLIDFLNLLGKPSKYYV